MPLQNPTDTRCRPPVVFLAWAVIASTAAPLFAAAPQQGDVPTQQEPTTGYGVGEMIETSELRLFPEVIDGRFQLPKLDALSTSTKTIKDGRIPKERWSDTDSATIPLPEDGSQRGPDWQWSVSNWAAANTFSHPRYFEDRMLERHGHQRFPRLQPLVSGARFFGTLPALPYLMAVTPACDYEYSLGYFRSGSRTPGFLQRPPLDRRGVISEAAWVSGAILVFP